MPTLSASTGLLFGAVARVLPREYCLQAEVALAARSIVGSCSRASPMDNLALTVLAAA